MKARTPFERFAANVEPLAWSGCILWTGGLASSGYGNLRVEGRKVQAHRFAWEQARGPIPVGMLIDHICHVKSCVNVDHLRLATVAENSRNRSGAQKGRVYDLPRGVRRHGSRFQAGVSTDSKYLQVGIYTTPEEASEAAHSARQALFGEFAGQR